MAFLPIPLVKMSGAGNTFVLVDGTKTSTWLGIEKNLHIKRRPFAKMICDSTLGVSADGVLFLENGESDSTYIWDFFNADGSDAEMCGNAARCAALYANKYLGSSVTGKYEFKTGAGVVSAQVLGDDRVRVIMPIVKDQNERKILSIDGKPEEFFFVNTGVPHLVYKINNYSEVAALKEFARKARTHVDLGPAGSNVTFSVTEKDGVVRAVSFERGVENFTQACGTGAVAAAYVEFIKHQSRNIDVHMPGGTMNVQFSERSINPVLTGEAVFVIEFQYFYEVIA